MQEIVEECLVQLGTSAVVNEATAGEEDSASAGGPASSTGDTVASLWVMGDQGVPALLEKKVAEAVEAENKEQAEENPPASGEN